MKRFLIIGIIPILLSCNQTGKSEINEQKLTSEDSLTIPVILPNSLNERRTEFETYVNNAINNIKLFAHKYNWDKYTEKTFIDSIMVFDNKKDFDKNLLILVGMDTTMKLPETFTGALEKRTLLVVTPEIYSKVYPEGIEENNYEKLLTHEIAHRLHIRILNGDEEAMGPIWFYEGFAIFTANQFSKSGIYLNKNEIIEVMNNPERGSYLKYGYVFRYFVDKISLQELIKKAKNEDFNEWLQSKLHNEE